MALAVGFTACSKDDGCSCEKGIDGEYPEDLVVITNRAGELGNIIKEKQLYLVERLKIKGPMLVKDFRALVGEDHHMWNLTYLDLKDVSLPQQEYLDENGSYEDDSNLVAIDKNTLTEFSIYPLSYLDNLQDIILPESTEVIGENTFESLRVGRIIMFDNVKIIEKEAFYYCEIDNIRLSEGLEKIGDRAFSYTDINGITIPAGVKEIGNNAFTGIPIIIMKSITPPEITKYHGLSNKEIFVPVKYYDVYKVHPIWGKFNIK